MIKYAYMQLKQAGIDVYMPGQAEGPFAGTRVIVSDGGITQTAKTLGFRSVFLHVFVPEERPGDLSGAINTVRQAMIGADNLRFTGNVSDAYFDNDFAAYGADIEYRALCAI